MSEGARASSSAEIRGGEARDLDALVRIYNHYVETTHVTFDTEPFTAESRRPWLDGFAASGRHRLLVAELGGRVVGYASSRPFKEKAAYASSVETSVYLEPASTGRGLGGPLYRRLLALIEVEPGVHRAYAGIALPNAASIALHERLGFRLAGTYREVGFKLGRYWDVSWYERDVSGPGAGAAS